MPVLLLCACSSEEEQWLELITPNSQYINLTITVSNSSDQTPTRAPLGGEDGNGRDEVPFERENKVTGITFILADKSMNDPTAKIAFVKYYLVTEKTDTYPTDGHGHTDTDIEKKYTTGDQLVRKNELDLTENKDYYVYVVANRNIPANVGDNLSTIKDKALNRYEIFTGNGYAPDGCQNFAMASEQDVKINFTSTTDFDKTTESNAEHYNLKTPILIERLAARLDFCTAYSNNLKNATYDTYTVIKDGTSTTATGFKYDTTPAGSGYFILESITPFNIYNEGQYLFERVTTGWTESGGSYSAATTPTYLGKETPANYIVDPHTAEKVTTPIAYESLLSTTMSTTWQRTATSLNTQTSKTKVVSTIDYYNIVLAYCMENTLMPDSPLKQYATGLVITGNYYDTSNKFLTRKTFYGYLRHQGETPEPYMIVELTGENLDLDIRTSGSIPMNFGIVRNNIYRVNIESVSLKTGIEVKMYDPYLHAYIYM